MLRLQLDIQNPGKWRERIVRLSEIIGASSPDFAALNARGGKVLWEQGQDDPSVSPYANAEVYPAWARYNGSGDINLAASFSCVR